MTDWHSISGAGFAVPVGANRPVLAAELAAALADPDPDIRDGPAYAVLATWIERGELDDQLDWLGTTMASRLSDPRIYVRSFAALALAWVVERGRYDERWAAAFAAWYPAEPDLRGYDPVRGWLHAAAHGADLLGVLGRDARVRPDWMLAVAARRLVADTEFVWRDSEDDRLGYALALILTRPGLSAAESTGWLDLIDARFTAGEPGPVPAFVSNAVRTLRVLYLLADRGVRTRPDAVPVALACRDGVLSRVARTLAATSWYAG